MAISHALYIIKLVFSSLFVLSVVECNSQEHDHSSDHPVVTVFRQFFDERSHSRQLGTFGKGYNFTQNCKLPNETEFDIKRYNETVHKIVRTVLKGEFQGTAYKALSLFVDLFPNRFPGSDTLDEAITYLEGKMYEAGLTNLREEESQNVIWKRGIEIAWITNPVEMKLNITGLSLTVGTPPEGIEAEVVLIKNFQEFEDLDVQGSIVFFNSISGDAYMHLHSGATTAAKHGAVAVLCRSPTKYIYNSAVFYESNNTNSNVTKIPAVVVSREDADKLERLIIREQEVYLFLKLVGQTERNETFRNVIGDYVSNDVKHKYKKLMLVSHVGKMEKGEGAQDDGLGIVLALEVTRLLKFLGLHPKRTIRTAIFSGEETGMLAAAQWTQDHKNELGNYTAVMEADMGCLEAAGFMFSGSNGDACVIREIMGLFKNQTNATLLAKMEAIPSNVMPIRAAGVPWLGLIGDNNRSAYWETKRSEMDSVAQLDSDEMDKCLAVMASVAYVLADMEKMLPRKG